MLAVQTWQPRFSSQSQQWRERWLPKLSVHRVMYIPTLPNPLLPLFPFLHPPPHTHGGGGLEGGKEGRFLGLANYTLLKPWTLAERWLSGLSTCCASLWQRLDPSLPRKSQTWQSVYATQCSRAGRALDLLARPRFSWDLVSKLKVENRRHLIFRYTQANTHMNATPWTK